MNLLQFLAKCWGESGETYPDIKVYWYLPPTLNKGYSWKSNTNAPSSPVSLRRVRTWARASASS